ncbi:MAG: hypothetical protein AW10_00661 [Candidatus Accumulibacter appositus]|uniref:Uncharacterized protein n=1 Tax=Candidatus Accumulibacter appositus TaxID=1454003 RepID=A0A011QTL5_9PROT|nr:MAG: hypothetical protein AW10_00661 [Candidatus Accumulibacter appositus]
MIPSTIAALANPVSTEACFRGEDRLDAVCTRSPLSRPFVMPVSEKFEHA